MNLRIARHTDDLEKIEDFYVNILGFERLGGFQNHNNYDGVFIGKPKLDWHFEFTQSDAKANHTFDQDDVTVLYSKTISEHNQFIDRLVANNISIITANNPYWNENGKMFLDPDGFRIVISDLKAKDR
ncbi:VOC family protein [Flavobacterium gawalongense]|uniref:VOC family protein n=1 Tax=Flavobacterium gawalongense TaxID=2594432 RepID=A0A553BEQ8_9FLAO|nr:VOC family protein [Flavobacterium gawalongense]TRW99076.1 VOC family protein [Flavobacterium gawalongense]TRX03802.1 VOC family protein [Flavobacterium gawalongense]TRX06717.1 VOC family protein [Flavobacterium gawalongense]TRX07586.1 VOC family protein [Flavobacterium gawalongense]TRX23415.1 VOC family protein [Flavobacterium gawalongense]